MISHDVMDVIMANYPYTKIKELQKYTGYSKKQIYDALRICRRRGFIEDVGGINTPTHEAKKVWKNRSQSYRIMTEDNIKCQQ